MSIQEFIEQFEKQQRRYYITIHKGHDGLPEVNICRKFNGNARAVKFDLDLQNGIIYHPQAWCCQERYADLLGTVNEILERGYGNK